MFVSKRGSDKSNRAIGLLSVCITALSLSNGAAFAENVPSDVENVKDTAKLTPVQKAGARGNLTELFKSPRRLSSEDLSVSDQDPVAKMAVLNAPENVGSLIGELPVEEPEVVAADRNSDVLEALIRSNVGPEALQDADPESRLGKIAAYRFKMLEVELLNRNLLEARKVLSGIDLPDATAQELKVELGVAAKAKTALQIEIAEITTGLAAVGGVNEELETDLVKTRAALSKQSKSLLKIATQKNDAEIFERTMKLVQVAEGDLARGKAEARELLEAASNTPVTEAVVAEVHRLLELPIIE